MAIAEVSDVVEWMLVDSLEEDLDASAEMEVAVLTEPREAGSAEAPSAGTVPVGPTATAATPPTDTDSVGRRVARIPATYEDLDTSTGIRAATTTEPGTEGVLEAELPDVGSSPVRAGAFNLLGALLQSPRKPADEPAAGKQSPRIPGAAATGRDSSNPVSTASASPRRTPDQSPQGHSAG